MLIGSYFGEENLLITPLVKWYLDHGLKAGLWSRKSRHPTPGNCDYPTPTFSCISYLK